MVLGQALPDCRQRTQNICIVLQETQRNHTGFLSIHAIFVFDAPLDASTTCHTDVPNENRITRGPKTLSSLPT